MALYDKDQTMVLVMEDQQEQEEWYVSMRKLMEEERKDEEPGDGFDEEDDGYCTLPPAAFLKEVRLCLLLTFTYLTSFIFSKRIAPAFFFFISHIQTAQSQVTFP